MTLSSFNSPTFFFSPHYFLAVPLFDSFITGFHALSHWCLLLFQLFFSPRALLYYVLLFYLSFISSFFQFIFTSRLYFILKFCISYKTSFLITLIHYHLFIVTYKLNSVHIYVPSSAPRHPSWPNLIHPHAQMKEIPTNLSWRWE